MTVETSISPLIDDRWNTLTHAVRSDVFHSAAWMGVLQKTYGFEPRAVILEEEGSPVAGTPFFTISDFRGDRVVTMPFSDFCDPLVRGKEDWAVLADDLLDKGLPVSIRVLHAEEPLTDDRFEVTSRARWHALDLAGDSDDAWQNIHNSARRAIRKARSEGVSVRRAESKADLRSFFELHLRTRKGKYGLLAQPYAFFENIWDSFIEPGNGSLLVAVLDDRVIAGVVFLRWQDTIYYKFSASDFQFANARPNDLIIWTAIESSVQDGVTTLDFGLSDWDQEGLVRYKRKYASREGTISFLRAAGAHDQSSAVQSAGQMLSSVTDLLTDADVPDTITEHGGEALYRFFA